MIMIMVPIPTLGQTRICARLRTFARSSGTPAPGSP